jgi:hypothetical protein
MRRNPERPSIDRYQVDELFGRVENLNSEQKLRIRGQWVEYAKSGNKDLEGAYLYAANLMGADLSGAYLSGADLVSAHLYRADLVRANLQGAYLYGANLAGADLRGAYLVGARLEDADLRGADLIGADLRGADLRGAIFPNYFKFLKYVGLEDLFEIKVGNLDLDAFFALRKFFRDRGQDEFGEFLEFEIRAEMDQVRREIGQ